MDVEKSVFEILLIKRGIELKYFIPILFLRFSSGGSAGSKIEITRYNRYYWFPD